MKHIPPYPHPAGPAACFGRRTGAERRSGHQLRRSLMKIWVDPDACPGVIRDILYRAAERAQVPLTLIARHLRTSWTDCWQN